MGRGRSHADACRQGRIRTACLTAFALIATGGGLAALPAASAAATVPAAAARPVPAPDAAPSDQTPPAAGADIAPPAVSQPKLHPNGSGKTLAASSTQAAALQAQLPLGLGGKGTVFVPPATSPEAQASVQAAATGKPVEVVADRDEHNSVFAQPDGTFTASSWADIQHVKQAGSWVKVDTSLAVTADGLAPKAALNALTLSNGGSSPAAQLSDGTNSVTLPYAGSLPTPTVTGNTATYANVLPGVDFVQSATTSGLEQSYVVKSRAAALFAAWRLPLQLRGLHVRAAAGGVLQLLDDTGKVAFVSGAPTMTDASGLRSTTLAQTLLTTTDGPVLSIVPDTAWLANPATQYPVTIDPTTGFTEVNHTYVDSSNATTNYGTSNYIYAGSHVAQTLRAFIGFNTGASVNGTIISATVSVHINAQANSARTTDMYDAGTISSATTYNNQPTIYAKWSSANGAGTGGWQAFSATSMMQTFANNGVYQGTVALEGTSETDTSYYKQYDSGQAGGTTSPRLDINFTSAAGQATGMAATQTSTFTPKLSGTSTNLDGGNVTSYFYVASPGSATPDIVNGQAVTVPSGTAAAYTVPGSLVRANTTYSWWMRSCTSGGLCSEPTAHQSFTIDPLLGAGVSGKFSFTSKALTGRLTVKVNNATGNLVVQAPDLSVPGRNSDVSIGRVYNSLANAAGSTNTGGYGSGYGWTMTGTDSRITSIADGSAMVWLSDGSVRNFLVGCGGYCTPHGVDADLARASDGTWTLTDHGSNTTSYYNVSGTLTDIADRNGNKTHFGYATGTGCTAPQVTTITGSRGETAGKTLNVGYTSSSLGCARSSITQTDAASHTRSVGIVQASGGVNYGMELSVTDAAGGQYMFGYTGRDLTSITTPKGHVTTIGYDAQHRVISIVQDPSGIAASTGFAYPAVGRVVVTDPDSHPTTYDADAYGRILKVTDANGHLQQQGWNPDDKVLSSTNSTGGSVQNTYGANQDESLTAQTDMVGTTAGASSTATYPTSVTASPLNYLPTNGTDTNGTSRANTYGGPGNLTSSADGASTPDTAKATYSTDGAPNGDGRLVASTEPINVAANLSTTYTYDTGGTNPTYNLTRVTPPPGNSLTAQSFTYDGFGRRKTATSGNGVTTTYTYDNLDHITAVSYSAGMSTVTTTYDGDGNLISRIDGSGSTGYAYDNLNRLTGKKIGSATVTCPASPSNSQLCYGYDKVGNLTSLSDGRGTTTYAYDPANNLTKLVEGQTGNTDLFSYSTDNQRTNTWYKATGYTYSGNIVTVAPTGFAGHVLATFDASNRLTGLKTSRNSSNTTLVQNQTISYVKGSTDTNVRQSITNNLPSPAVTTAYGYDSSGRLASAVPTSGTAYYYCYDGDGNLLTRTDNTTPCTSSSGPHTYNSANQLTDTGYGSTAYDNDGNLTTSPASNLNLTSLTYTGADTTASITPSGASTNNLGYAGTDQTERVSQSQPGATSYTNGLTGIQAETTSSATTYYERDPSGGLIAEQTPGGEYYYYTDPIGSVLGLIDTTGAQVATYSYNPYGSSMVIGAGSSPDTTIANANPYRYTSAYYDSATHIYKMGARYYDQVLGRFTQLDPVSHLLDLRQGNGYGYAGDDPINDSDPTGKNVLDDIGNGIEDAASDVGDAAEAAYDEADDLYNQFSPVGAVTYGVGALVGSGVTLLTGDPVAGLIVGGYAGAFAGTLTYGLTSSSEQ